MLALFIFGARPTGCCQEWSRAADLNFSTCKINRAVVVGNRISPECSTKRKMHRRQTYGRASLAAGKRSYESFALPTKKCQSGDELRILFRNLPVPDSN